MHASAAPAARERALQLCRHAAAFSAMAIRQLRNVQWDSVHAVQTFRAAPLQAMRLLVCILTSERSQTLWTSAICLHALILIWASQNRNFAILDFEIWKSYRKRTWRGRRIMDVRNSFWTDLDRYR